MEMPAVRTARTRALARAARAGAAIVLVAGAAPAIAPGAAGIGAPAPVTGLAAPSTAVFTSAAAGTDGTALLAGTQQSGAGRQPFAAVGRGGALPTAATALGPAGVITGGPQAVLDDAGHGAVIFARGKTVYLSRCAAGGCDAPRAVGTSAVLPEPAVALQPGGGRITVLWRGRTSRGARLQWRITTGGRLGRVHTLGEVGDDPQLAVDASGKAVAIWARGGLRTAARRVGEFTAPQTVQAGMVASARLVAGSDGETIAAWLSSGRLDVQTPSAQALVAVRTPNRGFGTPVAIGGPDTGVLALDRAPDGRAVLALDRQLGATSAIPEAATRPPRGAFGPPQPLAPAQFVPTPFGPSAAIDDRGAATVAWSSGGLPAGLPPAPAGFFAARADAGSAFGAPQLLSTDATTANQQRPVLAAAGSRTIAGWSTPAGAVVAEAQG
jgi:hypothetical protein